MRSGGGGGQYGLPDAVNHNGHGQIRQMSCNPAIGGVAKGQIVREIDAMGGYTGIVTDRTNAAIPYAEPFERAGDVESARAVRQGALLAAVARNARKHAKSLPVARRRNRPSDRTKYGRRGHDSDGSAIPLESRYFDRRNLPRRVDAHRPDACSGRSRRRSRFARLSAQLAGLGFEVGRMKTGTPARLDARSIDFSRLEEQQGDETPGKFSYSTDTECIKKQIPCYLVYTSKEVHDILRSGFADSPLFNGTIKGIGPRYCPSIEDKLRTFAGKIPINFFSNPKEPTPTNTT